MRFTLLLLCASFLLPQALRAQGTAAQAAPNAPPTQSSATNPAAQGAQNSPAQAAPQNQRNPCLAALVFRRPQNTDMNFRMLHDEECIDDWPDLQRFHDDDLRLVQAGPVKGRVVFLGDSITQGWDLARYFPGRPYVNRGISAQTTPEMLIRMRPDVIALKPQAVLVLAGTNDLAGNTGPSTVEMIEDNYASLGDLARANGIKLIFASVTPINDYGVNQSKQRPPEKIQALNGWLKQYCLQTGCIYLDFYSHLLDERGMLKRELSKDGLHPNDKGYEVMAPLAAAAVEKALQ
ncbi:MAG TPA: SGNH/GDSL hydrolase family protein [Terriglobales bacterium]